MNTLLLVEDKVMTLDKFDYCNVNGHMRRNLILQRMLLFVSNGVRFVEA